MSILENIKEKIGKWALEKPGMITTKSPGYFCPMSGNRLTYHKFTERYGQVLWFCSNFSCTFTEWRRLKREDEAHSTNS